MSRRFRVTFDVEYPYDTGSEDVANEVGDALAAYWSLWDYNSEVEVKPLDTDTQADGSAEDDVL